MSLVGWPHAEGFNPGRMASWPCILRTAPQPTCSSHGWRGKGATHERHLPLHRTHHLLGCIILIHGLCIDMVEGEPHLDSSPRLGGKAGLGPAARDEHQVGASARAEAVTCMGGRCARIPVEVQRHKEEAVAGFDAGIVLPSVTHQAKEPMNDLYWWMGFILFWAIAIAWAAFSMFVGCLSIVYAIPRLEYFMRANWSLLTPRSRSFKWDIEVAS